MHFLAENISFQFIERKNKFNCTNVVDGVKGDSQISNLFKDKYERLFKSVKYVESEAELLKRNIHAEAETVGNKSETCRGSKCVHCHIISSADVSIAIKKTKIRQSQWFSVLQQF